MQRLLTMAAGRGFAIVDGVGVIDEVALDLGVPLLTARFLVGRRLGWGAFDGGWIRRGRLGGVGRILLEPGFQISETLFVVLDEGKNSGLSSRWDFLPEFVRNWRFLIHAAGLAIKLRLGNLDA